MERISPAGMSRRAVMAAGLAALAAGCNYGFDPNDDNASQDVDDQQPQNTQGSGDGDDGNNEDSNDGGGGNTDVQALTTTGDVPAGGGVILDEVVVTQPEDGQFKAFSSVCTHQGCAVDEVAEGTINCPCHGSRYSIADGSVVAAANGGDPSQQDPLPEIPIAVDGDNINLA